MKDNINTQSHNSNASAHQRQRLLNYLQNNRSITTLEARHKLDIMHPAGRKKELVDKDGHNIVTNWRIDHTPEGKKHRVAEYILKPGKKEVTQ